MQLLQRLQSIARRSESQFIWKQFSKGEVRRNFRIAKAMPCWEYPQHGIAIFDKIATHLGVLFSTY